MPAIRLKNFWLLIGIVIPAYFILLTGSCQKDQIDDNPKIKLTFSQDTVFFDTVFTSLGSTTQSFTVHNTSKHKISISSIRLAGGQSSYYRMNVDGQPAFQVNDIEIGAEDSMYIFLRVTIDPSDVRSPFIVSDSIVFETNGNIQDVNLVAWGQNANYILADTYIPGYPKFKIIAHEFEEVTWNSDRPYVIYGYAVVDSNAVLKISRGTQIYFHNKSGLWVYKGGNIIVKGTVDAPVVFQGDRLESFYADIAGQWDRIWINEGSVNNEIDYAIIKNGFIGLQLETLQAQMGNQMILQNTTIQNMSGYGILTRFYNMTAYNNLVINCGNYLAALTWGGYYDIRQCTFANYWSQSVRVTPSIVLNNYFTDDSSTVYPFQFEAYFGNNIFTGRNDEEMLFLFDAGAPYSYKFDHCELQTQLDITNPDTFVDCLKNVDPQFMDYLNYDFQLDTLSPLINTGSIQVVTESFFDLHRDLLENVRPVDLPDMGAYEFQFQVPGSGFRVSK